MSETADAGPDLPFVYGAPPLRGQLRQRPEDFIVEEKLAHATSGSGEHLWLVLRKRGTNTDWLAGELARFCGVKRAAVSYAGLKDRHALTTQTFSIHLPGRDAPDWSGFGHIDVECVSATRHDRKLRRGALSGNDFVITLREVSGNRAQAESRLAAIRRTGIANYFGEQRFGRDGGNVAAAQRYFSGGRVSRKQRGLLLSAARAHIFNAVLAERVAAGNWDDCLDGEVCCLAGSRSWFCVSGDEPDLQSRLAAADIHPSGPMWGQGELPSASAAAALETRVADQHPLLRDGLARAGLKQDRRPLRLMPTDIQWEWPDKQSLRIRFGLPAGAYATSVLREIIDWS